MDILSSQWSRSRPYLKIYYAGPSHIITYIGFVVRICPHVMTSPRRWAKGGGWFHPLFRASPTNPPPPPHPLPKWKPNPQLQRSCSLIFSLISCVQQSMHAHAHTPSLSILGSGRKWNGIIFQPQILSRIYMNIYFLKYRLVFFRVWAYDMRCKDRQNDLLEWTK